MHLVIGKTSQLAHYFPEDYIKISSRDIDLNYLKNNSWDSVYITFAEQRIYDKGIDFITPNYLYILQIINALLENSKKIVCYTTCGLWNDLSGYITLDTKPKFETWNNEYVISKLLLWNKITELRKVNSLYEKVIFMHPFYFNSVYRSEYFLFGKIFNSIIKKQRIEVGNLDFYRDMVHTKFVVKKSIEQSQDTMMGAGKLFNIKDFVKDLYEMNNMDFSYFVKENNPLTFVSKERLMMAKVPWSYTYQDLLSDTQIELKQLIGS